MDRLLRATVRLRELHYGISRAQTMTEYALIMAAIAIAVFTAYSRMGSNVGSVVNKVNSDLTAAS